MMSILKVIEILADSEKSWEDAARNAVEKANDSVKNIRSLYVQEQSATVSDGKISKYRVNVKITFEVK
ncbi:MAG: dodecin domain-containing protein [Saprospiraceae bacterium]|nr:dodecin domain-containing protein [Saprospiraceae bacterium]